MSSFFRKDTHSSERGGCHRIDKTPQKQSVQSCYNLVVLKKLIIIFLGFIFVFKTVNAQEEFSVNSIVEYKIREDGNTAITHTVSIKNLTSHEYTRSYIVKLANLEPVNVKGYEDGNLIPTRVGKSGNGYNITLNFPEPLAGKGKVRTFVLAYEENNLAHLSGEVWEVSIPRLQNDYTNYKVNLSIPDSFGEEALISPEPLDKKENQQRLTYIFDGQDLQKSGITAVFGKFQVYSFKLKYHLKNTDDRKKELAIAVPPDTSTQRIYFEKITPEPNHVQIDDDGNWIVTFEVAPKDNWEVVVNGYAQVFANPIKYLTPYPATLLANLKPREYWESDDPQIKNLADQLKTPEAIYNFVTENLTYDYDRVTPDVERLGAKKALAQTDNAICTEFTDLFIAISRAAGIPAREINGYAHSDNPELQPLSLVADILHAWPEYWDDKTQTWIPIDPTWESTSNIDYFNKFDLKHIAFVIHGKESDFPLAAGSYKSDSLEKDIFVEYSTLPENKNPVIDIDHQIPSGFNLFQKKVIINIKNKGVSAYYNLSPKVLLPDREIAVDTITVLPPYAVYQTKVDISLGLFAINTPENITVIADHTRKDIVLNKTTFVIQQLLLFLSILLLTLIYLAGKTGKLKFKIFYSLIDKIRKSVSKY
jgi:hypothetical protein